MSVNIERAINRYIHYPRMLRRVRHEFDVFHIVDHSYAHLVHSLPAERTIVTCHDIDAFRCLLPPERGSYSILHRTVSRRVLAGLRRAASISCDSEATRQELTGNGFASGERCVVITLGVSSVFTPVASTIDDAEARRLLGLSGDTIEILHVGSVVPRKRIDRLLHAIGGIRRQWPQVRLVRVGGNFTPEQQRLVRALDLERSVVVIPPILAKTLAAIYRQAALVLITSEREGFGLPLIEALACGTPVLASAIPALCEAGGTAVEYAPLDDLNAWIEIAGKLLQERVCSPAAWAKRRAAAVRRADEFSWDDAVRKIVMLYRQVAN
jgi:glycosyltransferase involved in cell wall biosynthesis